MENFEDKVRDTITESMKPYLYNFDTEVDSIVDSIQDNWCFDLYNQLCVLFDSDPNDEAKEDILDLLMNYNRFTINVK